MHTEQQWNAMKMKYDCERVLDFNESAVRLLLHIMFFFLYFFCSLHVFIIYGRMKRLHKYFKLISPNQLVSN